ncbi:carbohydrate ABC transporter permease [Paenibacillus yanchengensis]|uniref:Carbohydrate ABC transporter permease n=1 Tax=Paenibacillus yanchengensis TaxID=2035833 RepID=A0ABW4YJ50_9BACL
MKYSRLARKEIVIALCFLLPSLIGFALFYIIPFGQTISHSLQDRLVNGGDRGITLQHYQAIVASSSFRNAASNTGSFIAIAVPLIVVISLALAMMLNSHVYLRKWLRTAYVLPLVVPVASIILVWQLLFDWNGALNEWLVRLGGGRVDWMKTEWAQAVIIMMYIWKNTGYNVVLFLAGLQNIPEQYYEIASLEGAGRWRKLSITIIYLVPTFFLVILMSILNSFKIFRETYLIAGEYPHDSIYMLQHYMNNLFLSLDMEKLSAAAVLMAIAILVLVFVLFRVEKVFRSFME